MKIKSPPLMRSTLRGTQGRRSKQQLRVFLRLCRVRYTGFTVRTDEFDYWLPREQIAQRPLPQRDASRLLLLDRSTGATADSTFAQLPDLLRGDELLVFNNARVIPARLFGKRAGVHSQSPSRATVKEHLTGRVEIFLIRELDSETWEALVRPGRKMPLRERVLFGEGELEAEVLSRGQLGLRTLRFISKDQGNISQHFERLGHVPLPPYIERADETFDRERYQTVFAKRPGAVAAPTAGLHFSTEILEKSRARCRTPYPGYWYDRSSRAGKLGAAGRRIAFIESCACRQSGCAAFYCSRVSISRCGRFAHELSFAALDPPCPGMRVRRTRADPCGL